MTGRDSVQECELRTWVVSFPPDPLARIVASLAPIGNPPLARHRQLIFADLDWSPCVGRRLPGTSPFTTLAITASLYPSIARSL